MMGKYLDELIANYRLSMATESGVDQMIISYLLDLAEAIQEDLKDLAPNPPNKEKE